MLSIKFKKDIKKKLKSIYNIDCKDIYPSYHDFYSATFNIEASLDNQKLTLKMKVDHLKPDNEVCQFKIYCDCLNNYLYAFNKSLSRQIYFEDFFHIVNDINEYFKSNNYIRISDCEILSYSRINLLKGTHYYKDSKIYVNDIQLWPNFYEIYTPESKFKSLIQINLNYEKNAFFIDVLNRLTSGEKEVKNFEIPFNNHDDAKLLIKKILYLHHFKFNFNHLYLFDDIDVHNKDCVHEMLAMLAV